MVLEADRCFIMFGKSFVVPGLEDRCKVMHKGSGIRDESLVPVEDVGQVDIP